MPRFEISARHEMSLGQGNWVHKGDSFNINIPQFGIRNSA